ncbi:hypothetical protein DL764_004629 [Monosporascus ibericus]|uniref:Uncharacterized protein n=1 Tax=Monosporascus ibericus TaxID=155417 RepID=A0A4Q4TDU8_9PEZI|nr:hypothetical protein DL764_004629 [Monosporascus ibericus]
MAKPSLLLTFLGVHVHAAFYGPTFHWGLSLSDDIEPPAREVIQRANRDPTLTRSVPLRPFERYWGFLAEDSVLRDAEWTWRINISNIEAPDADNYYGDAIADPHVTSVTYDFSWSADGNISTALDGASGPLCVMTLQDAVDLPVAATNGYTEDNGDSSSCEPVLGRECVAALLAQVPKPRGTDCMFPIRTPWSEVPECRDSFGAFSPYGQSFMDWPLRRNVSDDRDGGRREWLSGQVFYSNVSKPLDGGNSRLYNYMANRVHIMMISVELPTGHEGQRAGGPELLCMRVNATELPEVDTDGDGVAFTYETVLESKGAQIPLLGYYRSSCLWLALCFAGVIFLIV